MTNIKEMYKIPAVVFLKQENEQYVSFLGCHGYKCGLQNIIRDYQRPCVLLFIKLKNGLISIGFQVQS